MNNVDTQYLKTMRDILNLGDYREGRNGGTYSLFGHQMKFDLSEGFPLITTKKIFFKAIMVELLWFLRGESNTNFLKQHGITIWDEWEDSAGELGPIYGVQWRSWARSLSGFDDIHKSRNIDQITNVIESIKNDPFSRRHIVSAWNVADLDNMALQPCHILFQFHVSKGKLNCHLYQRSADWFLGVPFNIASYALLTILMARETGLQPGCFTHSFGDYHLYGNHREQALQQLLREPMPDLPRIHIDAHPSKSIFELTPADIKLLDYNSHPSIRAEVSK